MWTATWKSLLAHKLRLGLTSLAVVLGVGFVSGTFILAATINHTFTDLFTKIGASTDAVVTGRPAFLSGDVQAERNEPVPAALVDQVKGVPGVANAVGSVGVDNVYVVQRNGKIVDTGFAPGLGANYLSDRKLASTQIVDGRGPAADDEVAIDKQTAKKTGYKVGDKIPIEVRADPVRTFTLVGILKIGNSDSAGGAAITEFNTPVAQQLLGVSGEFQEIDVRADSGVSSATVKTRIQAALGDAYKVRTGKEAGKEIADQINKGVGQFTSFISIFGYIALFVGSFIIVNTFGILVAQRTRELALLRALGASRRQVRTSVLVEAAFTGVFGSLIGIGLGLVVATAFKSFIGSMSGGALNQQSLIVPPIKLILTFVGGVALTCVAAFAPAWRAAKVPPIAAMREAATGDAPLTVRTIVGGMLLLVGAVVLAAGLFAGAGLLLVGIGVATVAVSVTLLVPLVARPLSRWIGAPALKLGAAAKIGRSNAMRSPRRTASTASALLVGLALVGVVSVFAASLKKSFGPLIDDSVNADFVVQAKNSQLPIEVADQMRTVPGVGSVTAATSARVQINGGTKQVEGLDAASADLMVLKFKEGSLAALRDGKLLVDENVADRNDYKLGQVLETTFPRTGPTPLTIGGIYKANPLAGGYLLSNEVLAGKTAMLNADVVLVRAQPGQLTAVNDRLTSLTRDFPLLQIKTRDQFVHDQAQQVDSLLQFVLVLLAASIFIAVIGIVNTLALSVVERTREIGLLRAVGMQRRQVTRMVRSEAVIVSVMGGLIGLVLGLLLGRALISALTSTGINKFAIPGGQLVIYVIAAGICGVLASIFPARRARKLNVLRAIATE